jgi:DNA ligase-associated metallophosphoesterase
MTTASFQVAGTRVLADAAGALFAPDHRALFVADLHLEKASALASGGAMLPPYDSRETLIRLERLCRLYQPERVYCLGDSFHDDAGPERLAAGDRMRLQKLAGRHRWIWITGNHDDGAAPPCGEIAVEATLGRFTLRHEAESEERLPSGEGLGEISGHFHPKASVRARGRHITGRCFVTDGKRLILPAFGAFTGGLDVTDPAISSLFDPQFRVFMLTRDRVASFGRSQLLVRRSTASGTG